MRRYLTFIRAVRSHTAVAAALLVLSHTDIPRAASSAQALVRNPAVIGPIGATVSPGDPSHDYPFFSATVDLASHGYVEEEFFVEGLASRYGIPSQIGITNTPMTTATVEEVGLPYRTRMIVRRPVSADLFNGTVLMEWQNVTLGYEVDAVWGASSEHILRRGYAWIGVSAQRVGVHAPGSGLRAWSPSRYGTLDLTVGGTTTDDSLQYDVFSQAGQAVRQPVGNDPMAGLAVDRIIAVGLSQGAVRLVVYVNAVHPLAGVFDGFMPLLHGAMLRTDVEGVKVFKLLSETDIWRDQIPYRQPDSADLRRWEVAGAAHLGFDFVQSLLPLQTRDSVPQLTLACDSPPLSRIPLSFVFNAAIDHMVRWLSHGVAPPTGPEIELDAAGAIARDVFGNALGGIRLSQHAVPTATNTGSNTPLTNACRTYGSHDPFDEETLAMLYPDHQSYLSQVIKATHESQRNGFIVGPDAASTIRQAATSDIGRR